MEDQTLWRRIENAKARQENWKPRWAECLAFYEGRHFVYRSTTGSTTRLSELPTAEGQHKPRHRARTARNLVTKAVVAEVSMGTSRTPGYEVTPTTTDPDDVAAAKLSQKVLLHLWEYLTIRKYLVDAYIYAVTCGEGFVRPFFNKRAGEPLPDEEGEDESLFTGEIGMEALGPHEVYWEPGCSFDESPYLIVEKARPIAQVKAMPGFQNIDLKADARGSSSFVTGQLSRGMHNADLVNVFEYLELPSSKHPQGRKCMIANGHHITPEGDYPMLVRGPRGFEHAIHRVSYIPTPHRDRDKGLVEDLIDPQRTLSDCVNKAIQIKNLTLRPQMLAPVGSLQDQVTDEDGAVVRYIPIGGMRPEWRVMPPFPDALFRMAEQAQHHMEEISSQRAIPQGVEAGKAIAALLERDQSVRGFIVQALADFHSRLGRHLLHYVQKYYSEPRLIQLNGRTRTDYISNFKGADLRGQVNVSVLPGSVEPRTRQSLEQKVMAMADRQWITPQQAMSAIDGGYAEDLLDGWADDMAKQDWEIQQMISMGDDELPGGDVPIADDFDNHAVHLDRLHRWMKSHDFRTQAPPVQEAARLHEQQHRKLQMEAEMQAAMQQQQMAEGMGMANAARPQNGKPTPDQPAINGNGEGPATPNQPPSQAPIS